MSRTYRNKNNVPKGFKVRDGEGCARDADNLIYSTYGCYSGTEVSWHIWHPNVEYLRGHGFQTFPFHTWKRAFFGKRKVRHERKVIKHFGGTPSCWRPRTYYRHQAKKSYRRWSNMTVHAEEWEKLSRLYRRSPKYWW